MPYGLGENGEFLIPKISISSLQRRATEIPKGEAGVRRGQILSHNSIAQQHLIDGNIFPTGGNQPCWKVTGILEGGDRGGGKRGSKAKMPTEERMDIS